MELARGTHASEDRDGHVGYYPELIQRLYGAKVSRAIEDVDPDVRRDDKVVCREEGLKHA